MEEVLEAKMRKRAWWQQRHEKGLDGRSRIRSRPIQNLYSCSPSAYHNPKLNPDLKLIELVLHWLWVPIYNSAVRKMRVSD